MTVTYTGEVASSAKNFGCFVKLLAKWRGSILKLVWKDLVIFLFLYFSLSLLYRFVLSESHQLVFEQVSYYCDKHGSLIPVSFVLGFYVSIVVGRWWEQFKNIPWIDTLAIWINANIRGNKEKDRLLRRTLMRYSCLTMTQCFALISPRIKKRFPTLEHLVDGGLLLENEKVIIQDIVSNVPKYPTHWIPLVWAAGIVTRARAENKIKNDGVANILLTELNKIKDSCNMLMSYDWISVPLVYTQVVTLAVYSYFLSCVMGKQWLFSRDGNPVKIDRVDKFNELDFFLPFFTIMQFLFYMGWLKTAESLLNPFGDDDDDFELNWFVDRNLQIGYLIVDGMHKDYPELLRDQYWDDIVPPDLPHTVASEQYKEQPVIGSTAKVVVSVKEAEIISPPEVICTGPIRKSGSIKHKAQEKEEGPKTPQERPLLVETGDDVMHTIHWNSITGDDKRPSIQDVFGFDISSDADKGSSITPLDDPQEETKLKSGNGDKSPNLEEK